MTNYSNNPGHVRADFFRKSGKWYMTEVLDMHPYYNEPSVHDAVRLAIQAAGRNGTSFDVVVLEPYHQNAYPIMIKGIDE